MTERSSLVVLAGAGASTALNRDQYPTTVEFFARLPDSIQQDAVFKFIMQYLSSRKKGLTIDIEEVLWSARKILDFLASVERHDDIVTYGLITNRLVQLANPNFNLGHLPQSIAPIRQQALGLMAEINALVFDLYSSTPTQDEIRATWGPLFQSTSLEELDVFTTNYDVVLETALDSYASSSDALLYSGIAGGRHKYLNLSSWEAASDRKLGLLTKLHGSIDWKLAGDKVFVGDPVFTGDHSKQAIIYPGFKGAPSNPIFKMFHDYFERALSSAQGLIVIGFAFRDDYINNSIQNNLAPDVPVVVLNPDETVRFPYRRSRAQYIRSGFDAASLKKALDLIERAKPQKKPLRKAI